MRIQFSHITKFKTVNSLSGKALNINLIILVITVIVSYNGG
jgi:hypothetical protein